MLCFQNNLIIDCLFSLFNKIDLFYSFIFQDSQAVLASVQKEVQRLEMELDTSNREKVISFKK